MKNLKNLLILLGLFLFQNLPATASQSGVEEDENSIQKAQYLSGILVSMIHDVPNLVIPGGALEEVANEYKFLKPKYKTVYYNQVEAKPHTRAMERIGTKYLSKKASSDLMARLLGVVRLDQVDREAPDATQRFSISYAALLLENFGLREGKKEEARNMAYTNLTRILGTHPFNIFVNESTLSLGIDFNPQVRALFFLINYFPETTNLNVRRALCEYWDAWQKAYPRYFPTQSPMMRVAAQRAPSLVKSILREDIFPDPYQNINLQLALMYLFGNEQTEGEEASSAVISVEGIEPSSST